MTTGIVDSGRTFGLELTRRDGVAMIRAVGRLVVGSGADHPSWTAAGDVADATPVVVDLGGVTALDAGGVGRLLRLRQTLARGGARLTISAAPPRVRRVLQLTRLDAIFGIASGVTPGGGAALVTAPLCRCA